MLKDKHVVPLSSTMHFHSGSNELPFCLCLFLMFINNQNSGQDFHVSLITMKSASNEVNMNIVTGSMKQDF